MGTAIQLPFPGLTTTPERWVSPEHLDHVRVFAAFLCAAREIADDAGLSIEERSKELDCLQSGLEREDTPEAAPMASRQLRRTVDQTGRRAVHAGHILQACHKDITTSRYRSWGELLTYCRYAAVPAGRFVFELHGEDERAWKCADGLYSAWQILSLLQNCKDDFQRLDRVYLPDAWMREHGVGLDALAQPKSSPGLRQVFLRVSDSVQRLIETARSQTDYIHHPGLRTGARASLAMADRLSRKLPRHDLLAQEITLTRWDRLVVGLRSTGR